MTHDVAIQLESIKGSDRVEFGTDGSILFARFLEIDGEEVFTEGEVSIHMRSSEGFVELHLQRPTQEWDEWANENLTVRGEWRRRGYENLRERFTDPADFLDGTNEDLLILGVRSLALIEARDRVTA